jgi:UDP-glucose 4-epimerase
MTTYLVTGGAGFVGSHLTEALLARGDRVRVLDNLATGRMDNLRAAQAAGGDRFEFVEGDVRDPEACRRATAGIDVTLHQAALASVAQSLAAPRETDAVNVGGTLNMLLAARDAGVRRFVYASSAAVYGDAPLPNDEEAAPRPRSPYAVSKLAGEHYARAFAECYGCSTVCLRYFNIFGPRQDPESHYAGVITRFLSAMRAGRRPVIYGDGSQSRDFVYVGDVVRANLLAADSAAGAGATFNVATGERHDLRALVTALNALLGGQLEPAFEPARAGDVQHSQANIAAIRRTFGYAPAYTFEAGLRRLVESTAPAGATLA